MKYKLFIKGEDGAITADWTVVTASVVGLGAVAALVVAGGVGNMSSAIGTSMSTLAQGEQDFTDNMGGWANGRLRAFNEEFGNVLEIGQGDSIFTTIPVPATATQATLSFDLIAGDSLDGEPANFTINGQNVLTATGQWRRDPMLSFESAGIPGVSVSTQMITGNQDLGGQARWPDGVARVTITVDDPSSELEFGISSSSNQSVEDEYYAIDNFGASF